MKRKILLCLLIVVMIITVVACKKTPPPVGLQEGPETGTYYYDAGSEEYLITLNNADKFGFLVMGENKSGNYVLSGETLTLTFNKEEGKTEEQREKLTATLKDGAITLSYKNSQMRFLKKVNYTVNFNSNEGSEVAPLSVLNGKTIAKPTDPARGGYAFLGWYSDSNLETPFIFGAQTITSNITLYAKWVSSLPGQNEFLIDFDLNYDAQNPASLPTVGGKLHNVHTPESRTGYEFKGWWISMSEDKDELSFEWTDDMVFAENTTLFALWQSTAAGTKLPAPIVNVNSNSIRWNSVFGATGYKLEISGPNGYELTKTVTPTTENLDFSQLPAGDYFIEVTALSSVETNNSQTTVRYYKNKALARVSIFNVIGTTLLFNGVENATKYTITIDCGDELHNHDAFDNGNSTFYNFANCAMQPDGIKFVVSAYADGYAASESQVFTYNKVLSPVSNFYLVESTQTLMWEAVENATNYIVSVKSGNSVNAEVFDIGNKTNFSLKQFSMREGGIEINVYPMTKGFNSPESSTYTYHKTTPASPRNVTLNISTVSWTAVEGATNYEIRINNQIFTSDTNSFDLPDTLTLTPDTDYELTVRTSVNANKSLWSDAIIIRDSMYQTLTYTNGVVSWKHVKEAYFYEVKVNDNAPFTVEGLSYANITLDRAGINTIYVRANNGIIFSNEATVEVYAYALDFYSNGGSSVNTVYKAMGDPIGQLPATTKEGYDFMGWYTSIGGAANNGLRYTDNVFAHSGNITLYAYYLPKTFTVTYEGSEITKDITYGNQFKLSVPVSNDGTIFVGWYSAPNGGGVKLTDDTGKSISTWQIADDATVYAFWKSALTYTLIKSDTEYSVKKTTDINLVTTLVIPSVYDGKPVSEIDNEGFKGCTTLITITIPDSITSIGTNAFQGCTNLTNINVDEGNTVFSSHEGVLYTTVEEDNKIDNILVCYPMGKSGNYTVKSGVTEIGANAFDSNTRLTGITLPNSITKVGISSFYKCTALLTVTFENGGTEDLIIDSSAFNGCSNLTLINFSDNLIEIGDSAFRDCKKLVTVTLPEGIATLKDHAFRGCLELRTINLPNSVASIATYVFQGCNVLSDIVIPNGIASIPNYAFQNCTNLVGVILPDSITSIGEYAFDGCSGIAAIELPEGLTTISKYAFSKCASLINIIIPGTVTTIGVNAFQNCTSLSDITIPVGVTVIDNYTFSGCKGLLSINLPDGLTKIGTSAFATCEALTEIEIPDSVTTLSANAFTGCIGLTSLAVGDNSTSFKTVDGVLYNADLTTLVVCPIGKTGVFTVPNGVTTIAASAFAGNKGITKVIIPESVTALGASAFSGCTVLTEVNIPSGVTILENTLFSTCSLLTTVTFAENSQLTTIGNQVFLNNAVLTNVTIPSGVTSIGQQAFGNCNSLGDITIPKGVPLLNMTFFQAAGVGNVTLEDGAATEIGNMAFQRSGITSITIPSGVTKINAAAFGTCPNFTAFNIHADNTAFCDVDGILYNKAQTTILKCPEGKTGAVIVPNTVTAISNSAFANCTKIIGVTIPSNVENIGTSTFQNCTGLITVTFDGEMKFTSIGSSVFAGCTSLTSITIPDSVKTITNTAFQNCSSLTQFVVSESHTAFKVLNDVLFSKDGKTLLCFPGGKEGAYAIPDGVTSIGQYAFTGSSKVTSITMPDSVTSIGTYAFQDCSVLTEITLSENITTVPNYAFDGCNALEEIVIPSNVTSIGTYVFYECYALTSVTLPEGLTSIGTYAFSKSGITTITLPSRLTSIGNYAFQGSALTEITIPASVTALGTAATAAVFTNCLSLTRVVFEEGSTIKSFYNQIFSGCTSLSEVILPAGVTALGNHFLFGTAIASINLPETLTTIGQRTFANCANLVDITIPNSVTSIGQYAFNNCTSLTAINIPRGVVSFDIYTFAGCTSLTEITLHRDINNINDYAFQGCTALTKVVFADRSRLTSIKNYVFDGCTSLTSIVIPNNVISIGHYAFNGCTALSQVTLPRSVKAIGNYAFAGCTALSQITIPNSVISIGNYSFQNCTGLTAVTFEEGSHLASIANYAFENCTGITSITLPQTVISIGAYAFKGWTNTQTINITGYASAPAGWKANWNAECNAVINWDR